MRTQGGDEAVHFYARHPISLGIVLARLEKTHGGLEGLRPSDLWPHDQDHFGGQSHRRRRHRIIRRVMLAEPEHIEADAIGKLDLLDGVGESLVDVDRLARRGIAPGLDEGVGAELHEVSKEFCRAHYVRLYVNIESKATKSTTPTSRAAAQLVGWITDLGGER